MKSKQKPFYFGMAGAEFRFDAGYFAVATLDFLLKAARRVHFRVSIRLALFW